MYFMGKFTKYVRKGSKKISNNRSKIQIYANILKKFADLYIFLYLCKKFCTHEE